MSFIVSPVSGTISADVSGSYALVTADAGLPNSRRLVAGTNVTLTDGGAGSTLTIAATGGGGGGGATAPFLTASFPAQWKSANYAIQATDDLIPVNTAVANLTMSLPAASTVSSAGGGKVYYIKDMAGSASINPFMVLPSGSDTIDLTTGSFTQYANFGAYRLIAAYGGWWSV